VSLPDRSERIRRLFDELVGLGPEERKARLWEACGDDEELRRDVESLLDAEDARGTRVRNALRGLRRPGVTIREASEPGATPPAALRGALADRYTLEREIGRGGMATVYLAHDLRHERRVAIKVLHPELASVVTGERFLREIKLTAGLTHPHILPLHDSGEAGGFLYYVMPYVEGESLRARLARERRLPVDDALRITREVADALASAHARGIVHRDIKPANILLEEGHAVVADFGIARAVDAAGGTRITETTGFALGTPRYMSPEQATGGRGLDGRSDLYSLGCVLYEMLAGEPPVVDASVPKLVSRKLLGQLRSVREVCPTAPPELDRALTRVLATDPGERFATAGEFVEALGDIVSGPRAAQAKSGRSSGGKRAVIGLSAAVIIVGAAYLTLPHVFSTDAAAPSATARSTATSIAILPFQNISPDPKAVESFVYGLREDLAGHLMNVSALTVRPLERVKLVYGNGNKGLNEIASELQVNSLLEASVLVRDNRFRLHVYLVDVAGDTVLWQSAYDGDYTTGSDLFDAQTDVAERIASALGAEPTAQELTSIERRPTQNMRAWALYSRGRLEESYTTAQSLRLAVDLYNQAIEEDPGFGEPYAAISVTYSLLSQVERWTPQQHTARVRGAAERALRVDSTLGEPYAILGELKYLTGDVSGGERDVLTALRLNPNSIMTRLTYAQFLSWVGRHEEALSQMRRAQEIDPADPFITSNVGWRYYYARRYREAVAEYRKALELDPRHWVAHWGLGMAYTMLGRNGESIDELKQAIDLEAGGTDAMPALSVAYARSGRKTEAEAVLRELKGRAASEYVQPSYIAVVYAGLHENDLAFQWLENAYQQRDFMLVSTLVDPTLDSLRSDPRFDALMHQTGLSDYVAAHSGG